MTTPSREISSVWNTPRAIFRRLAANRETFVRSHRYLGMTQPDTWYVAYGPDKAVKTDTSATSAVRSNRAFKSEVDAKLFALQILAKGWSASAGTLNPHEPKQFVPASEVERWAATAKVVAANGEADTPRTLV